MALIYRGIDIMAWTKDLLDNPVGQPQIDALINGLTSYYPTLTHIGISMPMNTNAQAMAARGSNFGIEPNAYAARFMDKIHNNGHKVLFRGTDCAFEGIYSFAKVNHNNGTRFNFFGTPLTDDFSSTNIRDHGYGYTSAAGNLSTTYLTSHQSGNDWTIVNGELRGPAANGWVRTCLFNASMTSVTMVAKVKKVGNQQIVVRASTNSSFPGYGLQMRDAGTLRIERPGLENLGEVTGKAWVTNNYYWLKLQAIGSAIKGKSWPVGEAEPGTWDIEITNATYTSGYCGFSGESSNGIFDDMSVTVPIDTTSFMYRSVGWIRDNISLFRSGDHVVPYPEASSHQELTTGGSYVQFFADLKYCIEKVGEENGLQLYAGYNSHLWTSSLQQTYNSLFTTAGMASYDHYGTAVGNGRLMFDTYPSRNQVTSDLDLSGTDTYSLTNAINEGATHKRIMTPDKPAYNVRIEVYVVTKGTGDWTMTLHDSSNNPTKMPDNTNFNSKTNSYQRTITNANLTENAWNSFDIDWDNPVPDVQYHLHLTSSDGTGTVKVASGHPNDMAWLKTKHWKANASAEAIEIDIRKMYARTSVPQYLQEWGDYWSKDSSRSTPVRTQEEHEAYLETIYAAMQRLVNDNILHGFNYWRAIGGHEQIIYDADAGAGYDYQPEYDGLKLKAFFDQNPTASARYKVGKTSRRGRHSRV